MICGVRQLKAMAIRVKAMPGKMCLLRSGEHRARLGQVLRCGNLVFVLVALYSVLSSTEFLVARCLVSCG